ncbi:hypothetical protein FSP39_009364 [Pinctada imbricata]|uniref:Alpha-1,3-mannosyl-glycoprotein 2-beta-N-acetylglucosaminyltransferase n=1 Tax=Pinctada imbricata TaxID=66713 RepID=A0AA88Y8Q7_PINIB|nr:hypothetical protein FSP39_009364 [Pinctada imbricata]
MLGLRRKYIVSLVVVIFLTWNVLMYFVLISRNPGKTNVESVEQHLMDLQGDLKKQLVDNEQLLQSLRKFRQRALEVKAQKVLKTTTKKPDPPKTKANIDPATVKLPILMIACDRVTVSRSLDLLLKHRKDAERFPIIVSQDCGHQPTADVINKYVKDKSVESHIKVPNDTNSNIHPDLSDIKLPWPQRKFTGYFKISRHYKWALNQIFNVFNYSAVIIVEDDLDISPDFYEYFSATFKILHEDDSLWCVSAWNDNGKNGMVSDDSELLYRTDFFPGLGWMMEGHTWQELAPKWPEAFWDDWMRAPEQRKDRVCIRPEICRTSTFGKKGVSRGLFFEKHLKFIRLNSNFVPFTQKDLSYLKKENYDEDFKKQVYDVPEFTIAEVTSGNKKHLKAVRVTYSTKEQFKSTAKKLGIMDDFKAWGSKNGLQGNSELCI